MKRIIFAGTPKIAAEVLDTLLAAQMPIIGCLTQPDRPKGRGLTKLPSAVKTLALQHGLPVYEPISLRDPLVFKSLAALKPDLMIVITYGLILPKEILGLPKHGCLNIHASILPKWRGAAPIQHAILSGDTHSGITIMQMDEGVDTGNILSTHPCPILNTDTSGDLYAKLTQLAKKAIMMTIRQLGTTRITSTPQDHTTASYAGKLLKHHANIDWFQSAIAISRAVRAFNPVPVSYTYLHNNIVKIWKACVVNTISSRQPGAIIQANNSGIDVMTGQGVLRLLELQFPGKKPMTVQAILASKKHLFSSGNFFESQPTPKP